MTRSRTLFAAGAAVLLVIVVAVAAYFLVPRPNPVVISHPSEATTPAPSAPAAPAETTAPAKPAADTAPAQPAGVTGIVKAQYGDWQKSCDTPPGASFEQCAIIQNVTAEDQPNVALSVIILKTADRKATLLRVLAPLGVLLPNGLGLNVDGTDMGRVAFVRCLPNGCVAEVVMDDSLIKTLSSGKNAIFVVFKTPEEGIGIPVSLNGFADGLQSLQ